MTQTFFSLADRFRRLRARSIGPTEERTRAIGVARAKSILRGRRTNPEIGDTEHPIQLAGRLTAALRRRRIRQRWQRDLQTMDDRMLRDIGVLRTDAEQAVRRLRVWI